MENYKGISLLNACFKLYSKSSNEKLESKSGEVPFGIARMDSMEADLASIRCLV